MKPLSELLKEPMSAEAYLEKKRADLGDACQKIADRFRAGKSDAAYVKRITDRAEEAMQNRYVLPGTGGKPFFVGDPPSWKDMRILDVEYLLQLNRMPGLTTLTEAYLVTGEAKYAEKAKADILNWIETCPFPPIPTEPFFLRKTFNWVNPWRILEMGIRMEDSWYHAYENLLMTPAMTPDFHATMVASMAQHAEYLTKISPVIWPNADHNHFIMEMHGLLCVAGRFPELNGADEWLAVAIDGITRALTGQICEDGAQIEATANYHMVALRDFLEVIPFFESAGIPIPDEYRRRLALASEYAARLVMPCGVLAPIGDSRGYSLINTVAVLEEYRRRFGALDGFAAALPLIPRPGKDVLPDAEYTAALENAKALPPEIRHFASVGEIIGRTGFTPKDSYFMLSCRTPIYNSHTHCDMNSFILCLEGEYIGADPSYFTYQLNANRRLYSSMPMHNTLTFGGKPPFEIYDDFPTGYGTMKPGHTVGVYRGEDFLAGDAYHENYAPDEHRRLCLLVGRSTFLVIDDVKDISGKSVELHYHIFDTGLKLSGKEASSDKVRILLPSDNAILFDATVSPETDLTLPSQRITVTDEKPDADPLYVTVFTRDRDLRGAKAERSADGIRITLTAASGESRYLWKFGEFCRELK